MTPFCVAARRGEVDLLRDLWARSGFTSVDGSELNGSRRALLEAVKTCHLRAVRWLVDRGVDVDLGLGNDCVSFVAATCCTDVAVSQLVMNCSRQPRAMLAASVAEGKFDNAKTILEHKPETWHPHLLRWVVDKASSDDDGRLEVVRCSKAFLQWLDRSRIFPKEPFCDKLVHGSPIYVLIFALSGSA
jgi:hypothetical protein